MVGCVHLQSVQRSRLLAPVRLKYQLGGGKRVKTVSPQVGGERVKTVSPQVGGERIKTVDPRVGGERVKRLSPPVGWNFFH